MIKYKNILFDLDGTITDSYKAITSSVLYAIDKLREKDNIKINPIDEKILIKFIGPPLDESFIKYYGIKDSGTINKALTYYRENYGGGALLDCYLYEGIYETMTKLKESGGSLFLATAKPRHFAERIIKHFNIDILLTNVYAAEHEKGIKSKKEVLSYALKDSSFDIKETVMIGDRIDDVSAAKSLGMDAIAVRYGFGEEAEFIEADYIADKASDILDIILLK